MNGKDKPSIDWPMLVALLLGAALFGLLVGSGCAS